MAGGVTAEFHKSAIVVKATLALVLIADTHRHAHAHAHSHVKEKKMVLNSSGPRQMAVVDRIWRKIASPVFWL